MNEQERQHIKQFLANKSMCDAVYNAIREEFLDDDVKNDIQILAASMLAVKFLKQAFKRMERYKKQEKEKTNPETHHV